MFKRILIANRGEIALRIIRACRELGIETVAISSEADRGAAYLDLADETYCVGPAKAADSYLKIDRVISAAEIGNVQAIHPGYGFLAENAHFADVCRSCQIEFIGPTHEAMALVGDKNAARRLASQVGVPTVPVCFQWLLRMLRVGKLNPIAESSFSHIGWRTITVGWATIAVGWTLQGMSLWAVLRAMGAATGGVFYDLSLHTTAVALGIVAGFVSQIPGGLFVREWVSGELLEPVYGPSVALVAMIIFRLVQLVSELTVSIILYLAGWRRLRQTVPPVEVEYSTSGER